MHYVLLFIEAFKKLLQGSYLSVNFSGLNCTPDGSIYTPTTWTLYYTDLFSKTLFLT